ncbi:amine oxidase [Hymenobacter sp. 15J16-1T3B]|uniref:amine oxidase n=1 Tax=Hymenobacter sp. 15J16-1T3B TaxID=2886941 RepID=UPI001D116390|nr:amine oxidase [Hymenobacter sp. 15J16-1T3B]MCC3156347.1 amine oxidase [Hymenobacter sp. 15J16-1T3B]
MLDYAAALGQPASPFQSFWMGGYECTDQQNCFGHRVDFLHLTGHFQQLDADYQRLQPFGIGTVREGIRWSQVERTPYHYDWSTVAAMLETGQRQGIQQLWDLCHFGYPDDLTPLHPMFARRFASLCRAFVDFYRSVRPEGELIVTPINEVSFMSWLGGDARGTVPYCVGQGWEVKYGLMRAYIEGVAALREADPSIRILTTEPLVSIVPPHGATARQRQEARLRHEHQYQAVDMLSGRICPELGGRPEYLDLLGFNYYYDNQWECHSNARLGWANETCDPRWRPLRSLLQEAYQRYHRPVVITETSHPLEHRPDWLRFVAGECAAAIEAGVPLLGVCLYPIIDRPDWDFLDRPWHRSGLWDVEQRADGQLERVLYAPYAEALLNAQQQVAAAVPGRRKARKASKASALLLP